MSEVFNPIESMHGPMQREAINPRTIHGETVIFDGNTELYNSQEIGLSPELANGEQATVIGEAGLLSGDDSEGLEFAIIKVSSQEGDRFVLSGLIKDEAGRSHLNGSRWLQLKEDEPVGFGRFGEIPEGQQKNILPADSLWPGKSFASQPGYSREHMYVVLHNGNVEVRDTSKNGSSVRRQEADKTDTPVSQAVNEQVDQMATGEGVTHIANIESPTSPVQKPEAVSTISAEESIDDSEKQTGFELSDEQKHFIRLEVGNLAQTLDAVSSERVARVQTLNSILDHAHQSKDIKSIPGLSSAMLAAVIGESNRVDYVHDIQDMLNVEIRDIAKVNESLAKEVSGAFDNYMDIISKRGGNEYDGQPEGAEYVRYIDQRRAQFADHAAMLSARLTEKVDNPAHKRAVRSMLLGLAVGAAPNMRVREPLVEELKQALTA